MKLERDEVKVKKKRKQVKRKRSALTQFQERLNIVKRKAMMRRSRNQDLVRRQEYEKKKTQKNYIVTQTNQVADAVSAIPGIVHQYMDLQMKEAVQEAVQIQIDQLQDSLQRENDEFLLNIDENIKNVLKGLVKTQVKEQVSHILPRVEESVNATLEAEVLTRSSHSSRTSYAVALKRQPRVQSDLQKGLNLDNSLPVSLLMQRNL
nr:hypothetical protein [Tanacetum cinerariifolium]